MKRFEELLDISEKLLSPSGCAWDRQQTLFTLQPYLLEEAHELIEAIDSLDSQKMSEELGDVLYALIFIAKLGEAEKRFTLEESIHNVCEKLIRRHPHVFGDVKVSSNEDIVRNWEEIKKKEKAQEGRKKIFDGIPPSLPALPKAQKMASKLRKRGSAEESRPAFSKEEELGELLWRLVVEADRLGIDAESALRRKLAQVEKKPERGLQHEGSS